MIVAVDFKIIMYLSSQKTESCRFVVRVLILGFICLYCLLNVNEKKSEENLI